MEKILAILTLASQIATIGMRVNNLVADLAILAKRAAKGEEITDAELAELMARRKEALADLDAAVDAASPEDVIKPIENVYFCKP